MAARGDVYVLGITAVGSGGTLDLQPAGTNEIVVHNIVHEKAATLQFYDGSSTNTIEAHAGAGVWVGTFHCTNTKYYRVLDTSASTNKMNADGMYTK